MSNHPVEQKTAAYRFHTTRMQSLPLDPSKKQKEYETLQSTARNNNFPQHILQNLNREVHNKINHTQNKNEDNKRIWATFTYRSPQIRKVTNLFRNTKIGRALKPTATLQQLVRPTTQNPNSDYEKRGIYKITCNTCHKSYVGQTSRTLRLRFQEHTSYIKNNDPRSSYALHILNCTHEYGSINDTMTLLKQVNKPSLLLPYEQMYIQSLHHSNDLITEHYPNEHNHMFELLHTETPYVTNQSMPNQQPLSYSQFSLNLCTDRPPRSLLEVRQRTNIAFSVALTFIL